MKIFLFPFLTLLAVQRSFGENICEDVTFDECDLDEGAPTDTLFTLDSVMCQEICQSFTNCNFFRFDRTASDDNCQLFEANYRDSCNIVAAPINRDVNACLSNTENTCDKMMEETCQYSGKEIYDATPGTITDATDCGDLCIDFEQLECSYWKFDKNNETCTLFDSDNRSCNILSGPQEPSIESCEGPPETVTIQSKNYPDHSFGIDIEESLTELYIVNDNIISFTKISPGLTGDPETVSFQSKEDGKYMVNENPYLGLQEFEDGPGFANSATFKIYPDKFFSGFVAFEPVNQPGSFIRHYDYRLQAHVETDDELYKNDASFLIMGDVPGTTTTDAPTTTPSNSANQLV